MDPTVKLYLRRLSLDIETSWSNSTTPGSKDPVFSRAEIKFERKRIQISLAATVIYLLFTALVSTVYTLHTSRRRADRTVFSVHKTQINSTKDRGS